MSHLYLLSLIVSLLLLGLIIIIESQILVGRHTVKVTQS